MEYQAGLLQEKINRLINFMYGNLDKGGEEVFLRFAVYLNDILDSEQSLLESYSEFLAQNQKKLKNKDE